MKKTLFSTMMILATCLGIWSCSDDDENPISGGGSKAVADEQNAKEDQPIAASALNTGVTILGASKQTGTPPAPTNNVNFNIGTEDQEAFQTSGFNISFSSDDIDIAGAYIQLKEENGDNADGFFDVPAGAFYFDDDDAPYIDLDFEDNIPAGRFCYDICLYDNQNNVSQVETICVEIESWGGNADFVGEWVFLKNEPSEVKVTFPCINGGGTIDASIEKIERQNYTLNFQENGAFELMSDGISQELDVLKSIEECKEVFEAEKYVDRTTTKGQWAYNEEKSTMSLVIFEIKDLEDPENSEKFENGELLTGEGLKVEIANNELQFIQIEEGDEVLGLPDVTIKTIFRRK